MSGPNKTTTGRTTSIRQPLQRPQIVRGPEVSEEEERGIIQAEREIARTRNPNFAPPEDSVTAPSKDAEKDGVQAFRQAARKRPGRKAHSVARDNVFIGGPEPVIRAFREFEKEHKFRSAWAALEELLLRAGVEIEDFDV